MTTWAFTRAFPLSGRVRKLLTVDSIISQEECLSRSGLFRDVARGGEEVDGGSE